MKENLSFYLQPKCMSSLFLIKRKCKSRKQSKPIAKTESKDVYLFLLSSSPQVLYENKRSHLFLQLYQYNFSFESLPFIKVIYPQNICTGPYERQHVQTEMSYVWWPAEGGRKASKCHFQWGSQIKAFLIEDCQENAVLLCNVFPGAVVFIQLKSNTLRIFLI